jgi:hypothetical protein
MYGRVHLPRGAHDATTAYFTSDADTPRRVISGSTKR